MQSSQTLATFLISSDELHAKEMDGGEALVHDQLSGLLNAAGMAKIRRLLGILTGSSSPQGVVSPWVA